MKTQLFFYLLQKASRFILIALLSCILTLIWVPVSLGQFPFSISSNPEEIPKLPRWDPNKAETCGKFWCSEVNVYGNNKIKGELTLGAFIRNPDKPEKSPQETAFDLEQRAKLVQNIFEDMLRNIVKTNSEPQVSEQKNWQFWLFTSEKPLHPLTPDISVGIKNRQTVVFVPVQKELGLAQQTIITVTETDAKVNAESISALAENWRDEIRQTTSNILWGRELDLQYPWLRIALAGAIILITLVFIGIILLLGKFFRQWKKRFKKKLDKFTDSLVVNPEAISVDRIIKSLFKNLSLKFWLLLLERDCLAAMLFLGELSERDNTQHITSKPNLDNSLEAVFSKLSSFGQFLRLTAEQLILAPMLAKSFLANQFLIKQAKNLSGFLEQISWFLLLSVILIALGLIASLFRPSRFLINLFFEQIYLLPIIWIGVAIIDEITIFLIDYALNVWAKERQEMDASSNRYILRAKTYSEAFTDGTNFLYMVLGIFLTVWVIGINPYILGSVGALAVVFAYLSRNLLEDMLNGILILTTDRYAVGDVIDLGEGFVGFVEDMTLYATSLRNLDGQVLVIPNGTISRVINMTKNWSRVNFTLKIAWNADLKKALEVMREVAEQMRSEPQWQKMMIEPVEILGIDELSHDGILVRLLLKTLPIKQWLVGREFRLRVKQALDEAGISLGVPQREVAMIQSHPHFLENNSHKGNSDRAREILDQSLESARTIKDIGNRVTIMGAIALHYAEIGQLTTAKNLLSETLEIANSVGG